jgi:hypothetical protein
LFNLLREQNDKRDNWLHKHRVRNRYN